MSELDEEPEDFVVTGPDILTSLPSTLQISYTEMAYALEKSLVKIDAAVMKVLEMIPPELYADVAKNGVYLAGGGALLKGLDRRLSENQDPVPCSGGSSACRGSRYRNCAEEHRTFFVLDEINDFLKMNSGAPRCQCLLTAGRAS